MRAIDGSFGEALMESKVTCFSLRGYDLQREGLQGSLQLKRSALLQWKMLLPQLNMVVRAALWERLDERLWERYFSEEFIERQLDDFHAL
jgi:hypothetical protein